MSFVLLRFRNLLELLLRSGTIVDATSFHLRSSNIILVATPVVASMSIPSQPGALADLSTPVEC